MGDKPGHYWDLREARWVKFVTAAVNDLVPPQGEAEHDQVVSPEEADVQSG